MTLIEVNMRFIDVSPGDISSNRLLFTIEAGGHREKYKLKLGSVFKCFSLFFFFFFCILVFYILVLRRR